MFVLRSPSSSSMSRSRPLGPSLALLLLAGCPGSDVPIDADESSSGATTMAMTMGSTTVVTTIDPTTSGSSVGTVADTTEGVLDTSGTGTGSTGSTGSTGESESDSTSGGVIPGTSSGTTDGGFDTGVGFIVRPDLGVGIECDVWLQDCMAGTKCMPWSTGGGAWDATACFPLDPAPVPVGGTCTVVGSGTSGIDNCGIGAMCWDVDALTNQGTCVAMCTGSPMAPVCASGSCVITNGGVIILCLPGCNPLVQDCGAGQGCYPVNDDFVCAPDASGGGGFDGAPCEFINVCNPGLMCAGAAAVEGCFGGVGCCTPFCDVSMPVDPCPAASEQCTPFHVPGMAPFGLEDVGVCVIP